MNNLKYYGFSSLMISTIHNENFCNFFESSKPAYFPYDFIDIKQKVGVNLLVDYVKELPYFYVKCHALFTLITWNCTSIEIWLKTMYLEACTYTQRVGSSNSNLICLK